MKGHTYRNMERTIAKRPGSWEAVEVPQDRCNLCNRKKPIVQILIKPTGTGAKMQRFPFCAPCWESYRQECIYPVTPPVLISAERWIYPPALDYSEITQGTVWEACNARRKGKTKAS